MTDAELAALHELLVKALADDSLCRRTVPTPKGKGAKRYGTDLVRALDAVEAEQEARAAR